MDRSRLDGQDTASRSSVALPQTLVDQIDDRLERSPFDSVEAYVTYALEELLARVDDRAEDPAREAVDEEEIEHRLRSLGYLD